jgi:hypothetical protein
MICLNCVAFLFCARSQHIFHLTMTHANLLSAVVRYYFNIIDTFCILESSDTQLDN